MATNIQAKPSIGIFRGALTAYTTKDVAGTPVVQAVLENEAGIRVICLWRGVSLRTEPSIGDSYAVQGSFTRRADGQAIMVDPEITDVVSQQPAVAAQDEYYVEEDTAFNDSFNDEPAMARSSFGWLIGSAVALGMLMLVVSGGLWFHTHEGLTASITQKVFAASKTEEQTPTVAQPAEKACDPNYGDCVPVATDVDCQGKGDGPEFFSGVTKVYGTDIYQLDENNDGIACN